MPNQAPKAYGNPWFFADASYQVSRTYTLLVRRLEREWGDPTLARLAGWFPLALGFCLRLDPDCLSESVRIDFEELAVRHYGNRPEGLSAVDLALRTIEIWKGFDDAEGFRLEFDQETGEAVVAWLAFIERHKRAAERKKAQSEAQSRRATKGWETRRAKKAQGNPNESPGNAGAMPGDAQECQIYPEIQRDKDHAAAKPTGKAGRSNGSSAGSKPAQEDHLGTPPSPEEKAQALEYLKQWKKDKRIPEDTP
jgi:hypothetical protein